MIICDETKQPLGGANGKDVNQATSYCKCILKQVALEKTFNKLKH